MPTDRALRTAARVIGGTHSVDLELTDAPPLLLPAIPITVTPVRVRLTYDGFDEDAFVAVRVDGRNERGFVDYYDFNRRADWPQWLIALIGEHRPADRDALVRAAALREAEQAIRAQVGSPLASALFSNGVAFAADLVHDLAATAPTSQEK